MAGPGFEASPIRTPLRRSWLGCASRGLSSLGKPAPAPSIVLGALPLPLLLGGSPSPHFPHAGHCVRFCTAVRRSQSLLWQFPPGSPVGRIGLPFLASRGPLPTSPPGGPGGIPVGVRPHSPPLPGFQRANTPIFSCHVRQWRPRLPVVGFRGPCSRRPRTNSPQNLGNLCARDLVRSGKTRVPRPGEGTPPSAAPPVLGLTRRLLRGLRSTGRNSRCLPGAR